MVSKKQGIHRLLCTSRAPITMMALNISPPLEAQMRAWDHSTGRDNATPSPAHVSGSVWIASSRINNLSTPRRPNNRDPPGVASSVRRTRTHRSKKTVTNIQTYHAACKAEVSTPCNRSNPQLAYSETMCEFLVFLRHQILTAPKSNWALFIFPEASAVCQRTPLGGSDECPGARLLSDSYTTWYLSVP